MRKLNNKGYMLVEIILAFAITFMLIYFIMDLVINIKNKNDDLVYQSIVKTDQTIVMNKLMDYAIAEKDNFDCNITRNGQSILYKGNVLNVIDDVVTFSLDGGYSCDNDTDKGIISIRIPMNVKQMKDEEFNIVIDYRYGSSTDDVIVEYTVSYDANGGSGEPSPQTEVVGTNITISSTKPVRDGYTFLGWAKPSSANVAYQPGDVYSEGGSVTLYAVWEIVSSEVTKIIVKYDANGGTDKGVSEQEKIVGEPLRLKDEIPTRVEEYVYNGRSYDVPYGFMGWSTRRYDQFTTAKYIDIYDDYSPNNKYFLDNGVEYMDGDLWQYYTSDENVTLYAVWKNLYEIDNDGLLYFDVNMFAANYYNYDIPYGNGCYRYNGLNNDFLGNNAAFPIPVTVYIDGVSTDQYYEDVTDYMYEVDVGDKWYVYVNGSLVGSGIIGDSTKILYYLSSSYSNYDEGVYYYEFVVDLSNNGICSG